jgi:hypothetical protein
MNNIILNSERLHEAQLWNRNASHAAAMDFIFGACLVD